LATLHAVKVAMVQEVAGWRPVPVQAHFKHWVVLLLIDAQYSGWTVDS